MWFKILLSCYSIIVRIMSRKEKNSREQNSISRDFPGGPVVKTSPVKAGGAGLNSSWGTKIAFSIRF